MKTLLAVVVAACVAFLIVPGGLHRSAPKTAAVEKVAAPIATPKVVKKPAVKKAAAKRKPKPKRKPPPKPQRDCWSLDALFDPTCDRRV